MRWKPLLVVLVVATAAYAAWHFARSPKFAVERTAERNVLLVTIDTLRADTLGVYGGRAMTPHLDALAASGARFDFAHAHAVVTLPSHASILSGRYPYEHGIRDNTGYRFPAGTPTVATLLKAQGFATAAFVGGFPLVRQFGLARGFDTYDDQLKASGSDEEEPERRAGEVVTRAAAWMAAQQGRWFAWVHVYDPHTPYAPPPEWASRFQSEPYLGEVSSVDAALGPLLAQLAVNSRPTLVIVTADHGEALGDHGERTHSIFAYESTLRVPLIVSEVGKTATTRKGTVIAAPVRHIDLLPTILDAVGAPPSEMSGASLRSVIDASDSADRPSYFEAMTAAVTRGWAPLRGIISGREKYIDLPIPEMYDLASDPVESKNLVPSGGDRPRVLFNLLKQFNTAPPAQAQAEDPQTVERLRSLGYVGGGSAKAKASYSEADDPKRLIELEHTMQRAAEAFAQQRVQEAVDLYSEVIRRRPDTEDAYRKLALVFWRSGRPADAIAALEAALRAGITQREVIVKLGQYLTESGQPGKAIALLAREAGDDPDALIVLGNAYAIAGRTVDAAKTFRTVLEVDPQSAVAHENLGAMQLRQEDYANAERSLRRAIELDPRRAGAHTTLGVLFASTGRKDDAIAMWRRALELDPSDENARQNLRSLRK